ncbi:fimbrial protein TcfD [Salmonella enterica]|uniref:fimbrial protein TcfD n=1 Tax=Salmonella enterica TaxID=28901 RepID=UPI0009AC9EC0|nr:fimbrial protein TcfD [Salmonella enterica]EAA9735359.1 fimbrial protein TcfD [Salmonella enterica]EAM6396588.1 fimbrial protein TcfD [Salmonella enterica]EAN4591981.1 fimbrial protein TcfD [Salmonella enterica]EAS2829146.1 fimbrial protein TcfD [Salmonella enterica]EAU0360171.1 fimbrial protein TcfD [Salmonella enterica]
MKNEMTWTNMTWCWLTLLLTGITPLNVWADSDIYNKPIEQTQDVSQPGEDVFILHNTWINFTDDPADMGTLLCFSESDPRNGACTTSGHWASRYNPANPIRLMFTDLNTGKTTVLALQGYRKSYCSGNRYAFDAGGGCYAMREFELWIPASERRKLPVGQWTAHLRMRVEGWINIPIGSLMSDITLTVTDHFAENAAIYFPQFGTATPRVDLNLHRMNASQMSGRANLDMCLYDGGVKARSLQMKIEGSNKSGTGFQVIKSDSADTIDYAVSMNYGGRNIPVTRGVEFSLDNVDKAATRPVVLPGQRQAVRCVPVPLTLTTQPFNIREKRSGEYQGTLTVTMLMGTQTP